ncbi:MAG: MFS transporter, partial [Dehalococcoidales bacterium]|nr:MFS transporter [Dehalococcoidales bacterium]
IAQFGWRETLVFMGIAAFIFGLPLSLLMRHKPQPYGYLPDGDTYEPANLEKIDPSKRIKEQPSNSLSTGFSTKEVLKSRAFWMLSAAFFFQQASTSAVFVHIVPYLESVQLSPTLAAGAVTGMTLGSLIGRVGFGFLGDFTNKRYLIAIALTLQTIGVFIFSFVSAEQSWLLILFLLIYSPGYGGTIPVRPALQADYFGTKNFGTIMGLMAAVSMVGGLASPIIAGWLFDVTGSYRFAWRLFTLITLPSIPLIALAKPPKPKVQSS